MLGDLEPYCDGRTRHAIRDRLVSQLEVNRPEGPLCVVSTSMGTVVALDALIAWGGPVDTFVTLGSPLGWEYLKEMLGRPVFPTNVRNWFNLYDRMDNCAWPDRALADDYPTRSGARAIVDVCVRDNYGPDGDRDPHHWYGYLSAPETGDIVSKFWLRAAIGRDSRTWDETGATATHNFLGILGAR
jgi:hypothetical protein